ncbi:hypothetical protein TNIN_485491 [Trichonephila inaurata madagascariensis]|uniref:Uncharacterized protein n=1 Tax=Trichonephila inaurata madagascariensis TaxID=2747483 RepID=A0A8X7CLY4_9ARAC|nr:hypothetical protein TNIN_485491 [Trichonephila inaurata madagascariensis]
MGVERGRQISTITYSTALTADFPLVKPRRYHTEEELRIARDRMDDRNITDENYRDWYHAVRRVPLDIDEDTTIERSELEERLISFLVTMEKMTTAMQYIDKPAKRYFVSFLQENRAALQ